MSVTATASPKALLDQRLEADLRQRRAQGLHRSVETLHDYDGATARGPDGGRRVVLCANDYLGLAADPRLGEAAARTSRASGGGTGAAHLVTGHRREHEELEEELADFTGREAALLFSTGYMANLGVVTALLGRGSAVVEDRANHASLLDAVGLAGARRMRYRHAEAGHAAQRLASAAGRSTQGPTLVVTDGVFSMDGDVAPLPELARACAEHRAVLAVDDAHGLGVLADGRGSLAHTGCGPEEVPVLVGTLGKAFGAFGAFVAGSEALIDYLRQFARTYVFTTAPPAATASAALTGVRLARDELWRRTRLEELVGRFRQGARELGLPLGDSDSPIQPVIAGEAERAVRWSRELAAAGLHVSAIRPPTVPEGSSRLRVSFSACHEDEHVDRLLDALADAVRKEG